MPEIDGMVVVCSVVVVFAVGFVVFALVHGQVGGGEAVVAGHIVHGGG